MPSTVQLIGLQTTSRDSHSGVPVLEGKKLRLGRVRDRLGSQSDLNPGRLPPSSACSQLRRKGQGSGRGCCWSSAPPTNAFPTSTNMASLPVSPGPTQLPALHSTPRGQAVASAHAFLIQLGVRCRSSSEAGLEKSPRWSPGFVGTGRGDTDPTGGRCSLWFSGSGKERGKAEGDPPRPKPFSPPPSSRAPTSASRECRLWET